MNQAKRVGLLVAGFGSLLLGSLVSTCTRSTTSSNTASNPLAAPSAQVARGRAIYATTCTACHNSDPKKPGSIGPDVWGSSRELLEARVLRGEYPAGYTPKRATHVMQKMPQLAGDLDALAAYLNASQ